MYRNTFNQKRIIVTCETASSYNRFSGLDPFNVYESSIVATSDWCGKINPLQEYFVRCLFLELHSFSYISINKLTV